MWTLVTLLTLFQGVYKAILSEPFKTHTGFFVVILNEVSESIIM